jgi:hypothetical protein
MCFFHFYSFLAWITEVSVIVVIGNKHLFRFLPSAIILEGRPGHSSNVSWRRARDYQEARHHRVDFQKKIHTSHP